jgi:VanZ family protein
VFQKLLIAVAWMSFVVFAYATLTHVEFVYSIYYRLAPFLMQPLMKSYAHFEHVTAFVFFGAIFTLAYPRHGIFVCAIVFFSVVCLEYLQTFTPDRHGTFNDAFEKLFGGALGIFAARLIQWIARTRGAFQN